MYMYLVHRECYEHALNIYVKLYGYKHIRVAEVLGNLGNIWADAGDKPKAVSLYLEQLAIKEEIIGPNSLDVSYQFVIRILMYQ